MSQTHDSDPLQPVLLHADAQLLVFAKPAGLLSVPGIGPEKADCLVARVAQRFPGARIVHRLDRDTSGVMVLATDADTHRRLSMAFEARKVVASARRADLPPSAADALAEPIVVCRAVGTCVVPADKQRGR